MFSRCKHSKTGSNENWLNYDICNVATVDWIKEFVMLKKND